MRFMHIADVHLGAAPDHGYPWSQSRGKEIWDSFRRCIQTANEKKIDLLLIAGDLFHRPPELRELKEVNYLFSTLERTIVVLMAGNHDYLYPESPFLKYPWNENVICMFSQKCERVRIPELKTEIYGFSYYQQEIRESVYDNIVASKEKGDYFKILLAHGGDREHIPIDRERLQHSGFDYIALGHIHKPQPLIEGFAEYSGALEPIDCNDFGPHGYIMGVTHRKKVSVTFVNSAIREYIRQEIEVNSEDTSYSVREKINAAIREKGTGHIYRIVLTGKRSPQVRLDVDEYLSCGRVIDVIDQTVQAFDIQELRRQYRGQLIGRYIESFENAMTGSVEEKALHYGLEALLFQKL